MKINYFVIPLITIFVSLLGSQFTSMGIGSGWYATLIKPDWTPDGSVIGAIWTTIFIFTTITALIVWKKYPRGKKFNLIISFFVINLILNIGWSFVFFAQGLIGWAVIVAGLLGLSVLPLIILTWPVSRRGAVLLLPYFLWVSFATYLNYTIWMLNG